jgi:hypothetical protein
MSEITYQAAPTADTHSAPAIMPVVHRIWPEVVIGFAFALTAAWICLLGYGIAKIIQLAI